MVGLDSNMYSFIFYGLVDYNVNQNVKQRGRGMINELDFLLRTRNSIRGFVRPSVDPSVRWSVMIESKSGKTRTSALAHPPQLMAVYPALL